MRIGIIGPSKIVEGKKELIVKLAKLVAGHEIVVTPDKGSSSEFFAQEYLESGGKKVYSVIPLDDKEFGFDWVNTELGKQINCGTWRNQPEKLNEECDILLCIGYAVGVLAEIAYSKWFKPKKVYIINELVSGKLPKEVEASLNLKYISVEEFKEILK
jgi:hypothetical protein